MRNNRNNRNRPRLLGGSQTRMVGNLRVGKAHVKTSTPSHVPGIHEGNAKGSKKRGSGFVHDGDSLRGTARRSTSINPSQRNPIDPDAPNLSPP